jgi:hypothetical protein
MLFAVATTLPAQSLQETTSLQFVPANASFYSTMLRNREQLDRFLQSKAFEKLWNLPVVQQGVAQFREEWDSGDLEEMRYFLEDSSNQGLVRLLKDLLANEVFFYGGERFGSWLGEISQLSNRMSMEQFRAAQRGDDPEEAVKKFILDVIQNRQELMQVPEMVVGFKLTDTQVATREIGRLEQLLKEVIAQKAPQFEGRLKRSTVGDVSYLTLDLDGTLVPWNDVMEDSDLDDEAQEALIQALQKVTVTINLGVRGDYLILATGPDNSPVEQMGQGELLVNHPKMQPLTKYFDKPVTSIAYVAAPFLNAISNANGQIDQVRELIKGLLPMAPISPEVQADLAKDLDKLAEDIKRLQPEIGALSAIGFEANGGYETVAYNWTEARKADASEPLTLLRHVGGSPIGFYVGRTKALPEEQEFFRYWGNRVGHYFQQIAVPMLAPEQRQLYETLTEKMKPLGERLVTATHDQVAPAFTRGEAAVVFDGQTASRRWIMQMPTAEKALPVPEIAFVWEISDADKLRAGLTEYFDVAQAAILTLSEVLPGQVPALTIPRPTTRETDAGEIKFYTLPPVAGVDPRIAPNSGLSNNVYIWSMVPNATERLMKETPLEIETGPLAEARDQDKPLATAWMFRMNQLIGTFRPWLDYAVKQAEAQGEAPDEEILSQVSTVLDVLECIRTASGIGYLEDGAYVSHSRTEFQDLE